METTSTQRYITPLSKICLGSRVLVIEGGGSSGPEHSGTLQSDLEQTQLSGVNTVLPHAWDYSGVLGTTGATSLDHEPSGAQTDFADD